MKALIVYDSTYGNTEALAHAMQEALGKDCRAARAGTVRPADLDDVELLIVGSPTQGGRPTAPVNQFLDGIGRGALTSKTVAAFDTRFPHAEQRMALRLLMRAVGCAAPRIQRKLDRVGGRGAAAPEGFIVEGKEVPLRPGERERAADWALGLLSSPRNG